MEYDQRVPMRDGTTLSADVFRPDGPGKFPVVLVRTVYDNASAVYATQGMFWASRGYAYVVQDVRGQGESEGTFYPLVHEAQDGEDTLAWCARQPWSSGKVGTTGSSYLGWTQVYAAASPHLSAMIPIVTPPDRHRSFPVQFGADAPTTISWLAYISGKTLQDTSHIDLMKAYCGPLRVKLYAASSARDTDWTAKLLDVRPDGYAQRLNDGIVRARFRRLSRARSF
jgi:putative CocE/NonD family hydrolase